LRAAVLAPPSFGLRRRLGCAVVWAAPPFGLRRR
jgi:hypothetical protein